MSATNKASDILTDKAKWLTAVLRPQMKDSSDDAASALFHTIREHYGMLTTELLLELLGDDKPEADQKQASFDPGI